MPTAAKRPCAQPGCRELVSGATRCQAHQRARYKVQDERRESASKRGYDAVWVRFLASYRRCCDLDADDPNFAEELLRRNRCGECWKAGRDNRQWLEYDHIKPLREGGERLDPANVQPLCSHHHKRKTALENMGDKPQPSRIVIVSGPPCAGKSTWARQRLQPKDVLLDYDAIMAALTQQSGFVESAHWMTLAAMDAAIGEAIARGSSGMVYVLSGAKGRTERLQIRAPRAEIVTLSPGLDECLARAAKRNDGGRSERGIRAWYAGEP